MEKLFAGSSLMDLGYRDYIAARFLLKNHFIVQGLTLASTAVEKYLKAVIVYNLQQKEKYHYHLDKFRLLKNLLSKVQNDVTEDFDPVFLDILENAFKIRYYNTIKKPIFMGFYINQFIGELDWTIYYLEKFISTTQTGGQSISAYSKAVKEKGSHLYTNNFIVRNENKKEYMEKPDVGFSIYISINALVHQEKVLKGGSIRNTYEGQISAITEFTEDYM
ncbi:HEPN domain-containing protein [Flavobacterium sp. UGB4466]|uniref:HEPN domain-containing protein n=1 Tax=Flavobacterium sp. UGB4466 TaxID=2730889 RepID=UPI00192A9A75|nr:HEPN domain-containing protein [Flavobacterium sp. UGB4466]